MDSDVRQKFEELMNRRHSNTRRFGEVYVDMLTQRDWEVYEAGMRAGEIAMREKALKAVADDLPCDCGFEENPVRYKYSSESGHAMNCNQYAALEAIRALPAAPEEKKP